MSLSCISAGHVFVSVTIEENDIFGGIGKLLQVIRPSWLPENIEFKTFTDGITNKLIACQLKNGCGTECGSNDSNIVLVRIYGNKTDLLIDRKAEIRNIKALNILGLAPHIYAVFENGLAYQYYPGVTLNLESVLDSKIWPLVARHMAKMHKVELGNEVKKEPILWEKTEQFLRLLPEQFSNSQKHTRFVNSFGSVTNLRIEFERLQSRLASSKSPIVFAHNDLLLGNVIYNQDEGTVSFIDYEYATYNYQAFDIANHFNEFVGLSLDDIDYSRYPSKDLQEAWIRVYLSEYLQVEKPTDSQIQDVYKEVECHTLSSHFLWGVWSLVQYELSDIDFDFGRYAEIRLNRYYELKDRIFKELS